MYLRGYAWFSLFCCCFFFFLIFKLPNNTNLSCQESPRPVCYRVAPRAVCVCVCRCSSTRFIFFLSGRIIIIIIIVRIRYIRSSWVVCALETENGKKRRGKHHVLTHSHTSSSEIVGRGKGGQALKKKNI